MKSKAGMRGWTGHGGDGMLSGMNPASPLPDAVQMDLLRSWKGTGKGVDLRVTGNSMAPLLRDGMQVHVQCGTDGEWHVGDIVLIDKQGSRVLHRLIEGPREGGGWIEKGDHQPFASEISEEQILGRVVRIDRSALDSPAGRVLTKLFTTGSRWEWKTHRSMTDTRPSWIGRCWVSIGTVFRRMVLLLAGRR